MEPQLNTCSACKGRLNFIDGTQFVDYRFCITCTCNLLCMNCPKSCQTCHEDNICLTCANVFMQKLQYCRICDEDVCAECAIRCIACADVYCANCTKDCWRCGEKTCTECVVSVNYFNKAADGCVYEVCKVCSLRGPVPTPPPTPPSPLSEATLPRSSSIDEWSSD